MSSKSMAELWQSGHISGGNSAYVESIFEEFLQDPASCPEPWKSYFENLPQLQVDSPDDLSHATVRDHFLLLAKNQSRVVPASASSVSAQHERKQFAVGELINAYRRRGHLKPAWILSGWLRGRPCLRWNLASMACLKPISTRGFRWAHSEWIRPRRASVRSSPC